MSVSEFFDPTLRVSLGSAKERLLAMPSEEFRQYLFQTVGVMRRDFNLSKYGVSDTVKREGDPEALTRNIYTAGDENVTHLLFAQVMKSVREDLRLRQRLRDQGVDLDEYDDLVKSLTERILREPLVPPQGS